MSLLRAFIAIEIPESLQEAIYQQTTPLRSAIDSTIVRWVPPANIHLTLKFLGDVSDSNLQFLNQMLNVEARQHRPFAIQIGGLGSFPTPKRPRVIWIGAQAPADLESLWRGIEAAATRLGYQAEERSFSPHLTIGRVRQNISTADLQRLRLALESTQIGSLGTVQVTAVHLFKSDLQPTGSVYTRLFSAALAKN
jgi:2'-5' RNA ligase